VRKQSAEGILSDPEKNTETKCKVLNFYFPPNIVCMYDILRHVINA
jgi:hypothetical protein